MTFTSSPPSWIAFVFETLGHSPFTAITVLKIRHHLACLLDAGEHDSTAGRVVAVTNVVRNMGAEVAVFCKYSFPNHAPKVDVHAIGNKINEEGQPTVVIHLLHSPTCVPLPPFLAGHSSRRSSVGELGVHTHCTHPCPLRRTS
jgi:hypothetical protein